MQSEIIIKSDDPITYIWLHLSKWESQTFAAKFLLARARQLEVDVSEEILAEKATGISYSMKTARDYLSKPGDNLGQQFLNCYYGMMHLISLLMVSDCKSSYNLNKVEESTKRGHGFKSVEMEESEFPDSECIYVTNDGLATRYLSILI